VPSLHRILTRLPSNLRPTTRECVHFITRDHFQSRDKDGGHTIWSAISENPMIQPFCYNSVVPKNIPWRHSANFRHLIFLEKNWRLFSHRLWKWWPFLAVVSWPLPSSHVVYPVFVLNSATKNNFRSGVNPWRVSPGAVRPSPFRVMPLPICWGCSVAAELVKRKRLLPDRDDLQWCVGIFQICKLYFLLSEVPQQRSEGVVGNIVLVLFEI